jgi:hypothetical protein
MALAGKHGAGKYLDWQKRLDMGWQMSGMANTGLETSCSPRAGSSWPPGGRS